MTGEIKPEGESAPPKKPSSPKPADAGKGERTQASESAAESEPAKTTQETRPLTRKEQSRLDEILDDLRRAGLTPSELKTFKREVQQAKEEPSKAAPEHTAKPAELKKPKLDDFNTLEEYETARDKYFEDLTQQKITQAIEEDRTRRANEEQAAHTRDTLRKAAEKYGEGADKRIVESAGEIFRDDKIHLDVKRLLNSSTVLADLMYVMGSKPEDFQAFLEEARNDPGKAIRRAVLVERLVLEELGKQSSDSAPERNESGQFVKATPPAKTETKAPPPTRVTNGTGTVPADAVESALKSDDFRSYMKEQNRRDIAARKGA